MGNCLLGMGGFDKNSINSAISPEFHITDIIPHNKRFFKVNSRDVCLCMEDHSGIGFAVRMVAVDRRAIVYPVDPPARRTDILQHAGMNMLQVGFSHEPLANTLLIGGNNYISKYTG